MKRTPPPVSGNARKVRRSAKGARRPWGQAFRLKLEQVTGLRTECVGEDLEKAPKENIDIAGLQFDSEDLVECVSLNFADVVVGFVQRQNYAEQQLLANRLEVRTIFRRHAADLGSDKSVVLIEGLDDFARRQVQLSEKMARVLSLLEKTGCVTDVQIAVDGGARSDHSQQRDLPLIRLQRAETGSEPAIKLADARADSASEALDVRLQLVAESYGPVGQRIAFLIRRQE